MRGTGASVGGPPGSGDAGALEIGMLGREWELRLQRPMLPGCEKRKNVGFGCRQAE